MKNNTPIVFVHKGWQEYVNINLLLLREKNPDKPIYFVTERKQKIVDFCEENGIIFVDISELSNSVEIQKIEKHYHNDAKGSLDFERFCFERWIFVYLLLSKLNLNGAYLVDSDNIVYENIERLGIDIEESDLVLFSHGKPHFLYAGVEFLKSFCSFFSSFYQLSLDEMECVKKEITTLKVIHGREELLNDMAFLEIFSKLTIRKEFTKAGWNSMLLSQLFDDEIHSLTIVVHSQFYRERYYNWVFRQLLNSNAVLKFDQFGTIYIDKASLLRVKEWNATEINEISSVSGEWIIITNLHFQGQTKKFVRALYVVRKLAIYNGETIEVSLGLPDGSSYSPDGKEPFDVDGFLYQNVFGK